MLEPSLTTAALCWRGRFTPADGLRGSNQARLRNSPCYGAGTVELSGQVVTLQGCQRTWLGIPVEADVHANRENVRNVVRDAVGKQGDQSPAYATLAKGVDEVLRRAGRLGVPMRVFAEKIDPHWRKAMSPGSDGA